ncbi:MAG: MarR family transcriptional regulator [Oscillospiraceae bacterium]|nr:MarR family transcriptional regulator [Oscillospiraceae bacterium]
MECCDHIGPLLGQCSHMAKRMMQRHMQRYGFTPVQAHAMAFLIRNQDQEETTQQELERFLKIRPSTVNGVVTRLEEQGFITRAPGRADARHRRILLTEKGLSLRQAFDHGICEAEEAMLRGFSPQQREHLQKDLLHIIQNLEEESNLC